MKRLRIGRPSPAMVVAIAALVMATAGTGYAAFKLPKNSVGTAQLKAKAVTAAKLEANAVTGAKIKKETVTGDKIKLSTLGTVPSAQTANSLPAPELHVVGAAGQPGFGEGVSNYPSEAGIQFIPASFYKDAQGIVHLEGLVKATSADRVAFVLPPGFRPGAGKMQAFSGAEVEIFGPGTSLEGKDFSGVVYLTTKNVALSGIDFRAES